MMVRDMLAMSLLVLVLLAGNLWFGHWFFARLIPEARTALAMHLNVGIDTSLTSTWRPVPMTVGQSVSAWYHLLVPACQLVLFLGFLLVVLIQLLALFLMARWLSG